MAWGSGKTRGGADPDLHRGVTIARPGGFAAAGLPVNPAAVEEEAS